MNREKIYHRSIKALAKAYMNDTLGAYNCVCCAVGNIVADACNYKIINKDWDFNGEPEYPYWAIFRCLILDEITETRVVDAYLVSHASYHPYIKGIAEHQVRETGYTSKELLKIEVAFLDGVCEGDNFNGLMAVMDALDEIHETQEGRGIFNKELNFLEDEQRGTVLSVTECVS